MLWQDLDIKIFEDDCNFYYLGKFKILAIKKENAFKINSEKYVDVLDKVPLNIREIDTNNMNMYWIHGFLFENNSSSEIQITDYGFNEEAYEKEEFLNWYTLYETNGVIVDKREEPFLKISYEPKNYIHVDKLINAYLIDTTEPVNFEEEIKDEVDLLILLKKNNYIKIKLSNKDYKEIRAIRVSINNLKVNKK